MEDAKRLVFLKEGIHVVDDDTDHRSLDGAPLCGAVPLEVELNLVAPNAGVTRLLGVLKGEREAEALVEADSHRRVGIVA